MLIAIAHIVGAVLAVFVFGLVVALIGAWELERNRKSAAADASIDLGIPVDDIDDERHAQKVIRYTSERFSSELFRNRLSDLFGWVQVAWGWLGTIVQVCVLGGVIWYSISDPATAIHAWWIVAIGVFFWVASVAFAFACKLLTGRFPGQARQARKLLRQLAAQQQRSTGAEEDE